MVKEEVEKRGCGIRWVWVAVALIAVFVAMAMSSKTSPRIALFGAIDRACQCARVISVFQIQITNPHLEFPLSLSLSL